MKWAVRMGVMLLLVGGGFYGIYGYQQMVAEMTAQFLSANANPVVTVTSQRAETAPWQRQLQATATLRAVARVTVRSEVAGLVRAVRFDSGDRVEPGMVLVELDRTVAQARLASLVAQRELAALSLHRAQQQFKVNAISQAELDGSESELRIRRAEEEKARAELERYTIRAPITGALGIRRLERGERLAPGMEVAVVQNIDRLYVDFHLPQRHRSEVAVGQSLFLLGEQGEERGQGGITAIDHEVDHETRNLRIEGMIENRGRYWLPGMFVNLRLQLGEPESRITLPQTAIRYNAYGTTLFQVEPPAQPGGKRLAQERFVETGPRRGDQVVILSGIEVGAEVVTVTTVYYGADAETMAGFITQPLEGAIAQAEGIDYLTSSSVSGVSTISAYLRLNHDANRALTDINAKVNSVRNQLPQGAQAPVLGVQVGEAIGSMYMSFSSDRLQNNQVTDYLLRVVKPQLDGVEGVRQAEVLGQRRFALRAWLDPVRMAAHGITGTEVYQALQSNHFLAALGSSKGQMVQVDLNAATDLHSVESFRRLAIHHGEGGWCDWRISRPSRWGPSPTISRPPSMARRRSSSESMSPPMPMCWR